MFWLNIACIFGLHLLIGNKLKKFRVTADKLDSNAVFAVDFKLLLAGYKRKKSIVFLIFNSIQIILLTYFLFVYKFDLSKVNSYEFIYSLLIYILFNALMLALFYGLKKYKELSIGFRAVCLFALMIIGIANEKFDLRYDEINTAVFVVFLYMIVFNCLFFIFKITNASGTPDHVK